MELEFGMGICKLVYVGWVRNKILLYSTGNYIHYLVINQMEVNMTKNVYIRIDESLCCTVEVNIISVQFCHSVMSDSVIPWTAAC